MGRIGGTLSIGSDEDEEITKTSIWCWSQSVLFVECNLVIDDDLK